MKREKVSTVGVQVIALLFPLMVLSQSHVHQFHSLSSPEKRWVLFHPFAAKKAWRCTQLARVATDSLEKNNVLKDGNGGQLDAFRHAYWMALLVQEISPRKAKKLGVAHEKGNYRDWKKGKLEEDARADSMACVMDLQNNISGISIGEKFRSDTASTKATLLESVLAAAKNGQLVIVKKDKAGRALTCDGQVIDPKAYEKIWSVPKCLVPSDTATQ